MFRHPGWSVGSYRSGPPAARTVRAKSMGGSYQQDGSPCILCFSRRTLPHSDERERPQTTTRTAHRLRRQAASVCVYLIGQIEAAWNFNRMRRMSRLPEFYLCFAGSLGHFPLCVHFGRKRTMPSLGSELETKSHSSWIELAASLFAGKRCPH